LDYIFFFCLFVDVDSIVTRLILLSKLKAS